MSSPNAYEVSNLTALQPEQIKVWEDLLGESRRIEGECRYLLSLLLINGSPTRRADREPALKALADRARAATNSLEFNAVVGAVLLSTVCCFGVAFVLTFVGGLSAEWTAPPPGISLTTLRELVAEAARQATWQAFDLSLLVGCASAIGLSLRAARVADGSWQRSGEHNWRPYLGYTTIMTMAAICVVPLYVLVQYVRQVVVPAMGPDINENLPPLWHDFSLTLSGLVVQALVGLIAVWIVCVITDHDSRQPQSASSGESPERAHLTESPARFLTGLLVLAGLLAFFVEWWAESWFRENLAIQFAKVSSPANALEILPDAAASAKASSLAKFLAYLPAAADFAKDFLLSAITIMAFGYFYARHHHPTQAPTEASHRNPAAGGAAQFAGLALVLLTMPAFAGEPAPEPPPAPAEPHHRVIRVGVRADAHPFAFRIDPKSPRKDLQGYDGFSVQVCRELLDELRQSEPFRGADIEVVEVSTDLRFNKLVEGEVDLLCGPDSIDKTRMQKVNPSLPIFLSGISYAYRRDFPRRSYCGAVVGVVQCSTAHRFGLQTMAERKILKRFQPELEQHLQQVAAADQASCGADTPAVKYEPFKTPNCEAGYPADPIRLFKNHSEAVEALCSSKDFLLYYVGDVDLIRSKIQERARRVPCNVRLEPYTLSREVYAILFRRNEPTDPLFAKRVIARGFSDALLYAEFNNALLRSIQTTNTVLERAFAHAFPGFERSKDLDDFFRTMKISRGWKQ